MTSVTGNWTTAWLGLGRVLAANLPPPKRSAPLWTDERGSLSRAEFIEHHRTMSMNHGDMSHHGKDAMKHEGTDHHAMDHAGHAPSTGGSTFAKLDGNRDGKLSKGEMAKHPMAAHFAVLDVDKNGYLSPKEAAAHGL